jgi:hypothetical protein
MASRSGVIRWAGAGVLFLVLAAGAVLGSGYWFFNAFLSPASDCANQPLSRTPSPDGKLEAVVFQRNCGATTDFSTQVSVVPARQAVPNDAGNVWSGDSDHGQAPSAPGGGPEIHVTWRDSRHLRLAYDPRVRVFRSTRDVSVQAGIFRSVKVSVEYVLPKPPSGGK